jgi:hypothetical protein
MIYGVQMMHRSLPLAAVAAFALLAVPVVRPVWAEEATKPAAAPAAPAATSPAATTTAAPTATPAAAGDVKPSDDPPDIELTAEEKAEKEARKACKVQICAAFRNKSAGGGDISCNVVKSWRKAQLTKLVAKLKVSWPYGPVRCTTNVNIKRADLIKAITADKAEAQLDKHAVSCVVDREKEASTDLKFEFSPKVTFEKGKATSAKMNWGKLEAPTLLKTALWTATGADNTVNILSSTLVEDINNFVDKKCDEVKNEIAGK